MLTMHRLGMGFTLTTRATIPALFAVLFLAGAPAAAKDWGRHNPASVAEVDHGMWEDFLQAVLIPYEAVKDVVPSSEWDCRDVSSRIPKCNVSSSARSILKGANLIPYGFMKPEVGLYLRNYLDALSKAQVSKLNKSEQLAYWLNLHNASVVLKIFNNYPIDSVYDLRDRARAKTRKDERAWGEPIIRVEGESLSIRDIEQNILFTQWQDPLILYGLFDGSAGSPTLPRKPFYGHAVYQQLEENGRQFVNSRRVMRLRGDRARVSLVYTYGYDLFGGNDEILDHIRSLASRALRKRLASIRQLREGFYEFDLAEFSPADIGGTDGKDLNQLNPGNTFLKSNFGSRSINFGQ